MVVFTIVVIVTFLLARFAIRDTERARRQNKFLKDMEEFSNKNLNNKK